MKHAVRRVLAVSCAVVAGASGRVIAQNAPVDSTTTRTAASAPWVTRGEAVAFTATAGATFIIAPFDKGISRKFKPNGTRHSRRLHAAAGKVAFFGGDGPFITSAALIAGTFDGSQPALHRFAVHNTESIALATVVTGLGKGLFGRALPGVETRHAFSFGRGFHDGNGPFVSFPSGHTAAAFAMAETIAGELEHAGASDAHLAGGIAFGGATAVGLARVIQRVHWPSDLPLAAAIGTWSGRVVQRHANDGGRTGAVVRGLSVGLDPAGRTLVGWSSLGALSAVQ